MLLLVATLTASCARDYEDDIMAAQNDMDALVQADADLRAYLTQSINDARARLNQMIDTEDATLQGEISSKMSELKSNISSKMEEIITLMNTRFTESEQRAQQKLDALNAELNGTGGVKERLQNKLNQTRQAVLDAQNAHNEQLASALQTYYAKLQSLQATLGNLSQIINELRAQFDAVANLDFQAQLTNLEGKVTSLEQFNLDQELDDLGTTLHLFTQEKYAEMTTEDLQKLNDFYADLEKYSKSVLTQYSDFEDDLSQYQQTLDDLRGTFDDVSSELDGLDTSFGLLDDVLAESQNIDDIEDLCTEMDGYESQILGIVSDLESCKDDCENALSDADQAVDESNNADQYVVNAEIWSSAIQERKEALDAWIEDLKSRYPWWEW